MFECVLLDTGQTQATSIPQSVPMRHDSPLPTTTCCTDRRTAPAPAVSAYHSHESGMPGTCGGRRKSQSNFVYLIYLICLPLCTNIYQPSEKSISHHINKCIIQLQRGKKRQRKEVEGEKGELLCSMGIVILTVFTGKTTETKSVSSNMFLRYITSLVQNLQTVKTSHLAPNK